MMRRILNQLHGNKNTTIAVSDNTKTNARKLAELAYQNRARTKLLFHKEAADKRSEEAMREREARRRDPEYDEKKRRAQVDELLRRNDDGKYTSKKKTFVGRFADNLYHNSGADYYINRAKELAKSGATPMEQGINVGLGLFGTAIGSTIGGIDAIGKRLGSNANVGTAAMGLLAETPIGAVPMTLMDAGRQLGGSRGENLAELATVIAGGRRPMYRPRPVELARGQAWVPGIYINPETGVPNYYKVSPNPNQATWRTLGANIWEPMSRAEIAEATRNGTMRRLFLDGNVGDVWRNIDLNGGVYVLTRRGPNGGRFPTGTINLPDGFAVQVDQNVARQYLNGTRRYPSLLNDAETLTMTNTLKGISAEFDGYGIDGPRYRVNYENGQSVVYYYPEILEMLNDARRASLLRRPSLQEVTQGLTDPNEILAAKWDWSEKYARNPELVRSIRLALKSGQDTSSILSKLSNKLIDFLVELGMLNEPRHTGNLVGIIDSNGPRPFSIQEVEASARNDWNNRRHGSVFDFDSTNSYSYQSHLLALKNLIRRIESGEVRLLKPGTRTIYPNNYASIKVTSPEGNVTTYNGLGVGRAGGAMDLSKLNKHYKTTYNKLNELGRKQYGDLWADLIWEDITPEQIKRLYSSPRTRPRTHADLRFLIYKNGGKTKLYDRRLISKIKGV